MAMFMGQPMGCKTNIKAGMTGRAVAARNGAINYDAFMNCPLCRLTRAPGFNYPSPVVLSSHVFFFFILLCLPSFFLTNTAYNTFFIKLFNLKNRRNLKQSSHKIFLYLLEFARKLGYCSFPQVVETCAED